MVCGLKPSSASGRIYLFLIVHGSGYSAFHASPFVWLRVALKSVCWVLVHLRTTALRRPQTRVRSLSSVTGNGLK
jgi:hypothetical protein